MNNLLVEVVHNLVKMWYNILECFDDIGNLNILKKRDIF